MNGVDCLREALLSLGVGKRLRTNEPLARYTSFNVGGPADLLIEARQLKELITWYRLAQKLGVPVRVIGSGTNILVADAGVRGLVIVNACTSFGFATPGLLRAESGALLREVARWAVSRGWGGIEWAVGIPGTIGGAVVGNAGAYGGYIADVLQRTQLLRPSGEIEWVSNESLGFGYRTSALKRDHQAGRPSSVVLSVELRLYPADVRELRRRVHHVTLQREAHTPKGLCAGSMFKRTAQYPAGFLIEQAGLKGLRIGGAQVSPKHANFLMNVDNATAQDIKALIEEVQRVVWETFAQRLEPEVEFIGEWEPHHARERVL